MINKGEAVEIVRKYINSTEMVGADEPEMVIVKSEYREKENCWIFYWNSSLCLKSENRGHALVGNGPILVSRETGDYEMIYTGPIPEFENRVVDAYQRIMDKKGNKPKFEKDA